MNESCASKYCELCMLAKSVTVFVELTDIITDARCSRLRETGPEHVDPRPPSTSTSSKFFLNSSHPPPAPDPRVGATLRSSSYGRGYPVLRFFLSRREYFRAQLSRSASRARSPLGRRVGGGA